MPQTLFIKAIKLKLPTNQSSYPFDLPILQRLNQLDFKTNVTFLVGENGTGKSTLLEAMAIAYGLNPEGGSKNFTFATQDTHSQLFHYLTLVKSGYLPEFSYFLRAESFYNLATNIEELDEGTGQLFESYGGKSLHQQSHGEAFFALFQNKFISKGIYFMDEPEAALSITKQLALLNLIFSLAEEGTQFIIATHSPLLLACPQATIYSFDHEQIAEISYADTEQYIISKYFFGSYPEYRDSILFPE